MHLCNDACKPGECPRLYLGGPSVDTARAIRTLTNVDSQGRRYYKVKFDEGWRRLRTQDDLDRLNKAIQPYRDGTAKVRFIGMAA